MSNITKIINYHAIEGIATITMMSEPINALSLTMRQALTKYLQRAIDDDQVEAVMIASKLRVFSIKSVSTIALQFIWRFSNSSEKFFK